MDYILAHEKHGDFITAGETLEEAAAKIVRRRLDEGYWYYDEAAKQALLALDMNTAWDFLCARSDGEYESVEETWVR